MQKRGEGIRCCKNVFRLHFQMQLLIVRPCILNVVYVFLLFVHVFLSLSMYTYCCLCILIVRSCILNVVYVFLL